MDTSGPTYNVYYMTPGAEAVFSFPTAEAADLWNGNVLAIKDQICNINEKLEADGRRGRGTLQDYGPWIIHYQNFISAFGKAAVPGDIRWAINDVEKGLGIKETTWPAN